MSTFNDAPHQALSYLISQVTHIEREVYEIKYPDITYARDIPVDTSAPEWIKSITFFSEDRVGAAKFINGNAYDIPFADVTSEKFESAVEGAGIGYRYSLEEINQARYLGQSLDARRAMSARRAYETFVNDVAYVGHTAKGWKGLINNASVTAVTVAQNAGATSTLWANKTADEVLTDINSGITGMWTASKTVELAGTVKLPPAKYSVLFTRRLGDTTMNLFEYISKNNIYTAQTGQPLDIGMLRQCEGAGSGATDRMVVYRKAPDVLKLHIPMPLRFLPPQAKGLGFEVPGMFRLGGVDIRLPGAVRYLDGI